MNENFGPGDNFPKDEPAVNRFTGHPPLKTQTANGAPGSVGILQRNEPVELEAKRQMNQVL